MAQFTLAVGSMKIAKSIHWYGLDAVKLFKMWRFTSQNSYCITVQFISVPYPEDYFKAEISPDGNTLLYSRAVPGWYGTNKHSSLNAVESNFLIRIAPSLQQILKHPKSSRRPRHLPATSCIGASHLLSIFLRHANQMSLYLSHTIQLDKAFKTVHTSTMSSLC